MASFRTQIVVAVVVGLAVGGALTWSITQLGGAIAAQSQQTETRLRAIETQLQTLASEVTRFRIEQRAEGRGPQALLEKLAVYAPLVASSRTAEPDFKMAKAEIEATLRAFQSLGKDAHGALMERFNKLDAKNFDELNLLLRAAVRTDPVEANKLLIEVLHGRTKPNPRLRWIAADLLTELDRPSAQQQLRGIMLAESFRGVDPDRAAAYNLTSIDPSAVATSGFYNFVIRYLRTQDPQAENTLLQMLARDRHDVQTLQEIIEWLGQQKSARAWPPIEDLYRQPPLTTENPLFLNKCLDALVAIRGAEVRPFLEAELPKARHDLVIKHIGLLLQQLGQTATSAATEKK